jgi:adenine deaminase
VTSDHELIRRSDFDRRLRAGLVVELRAANPAVILEAAADALLALRAVPHSVVAATDDLLADHLAKRGGIDYLLRVLIGRGLDPIDAIRIATLNGAMRLGRDDIGRLVAGCQANLSIVRSLEELEISEVFSRGVVVTDGGPAGESIRDDWAESFHLEPTTSDVVWPMSPPLRDGVISLKAIHGIGLTSWVDADVQIKDGTLLPSPGQVVQTVLHRYGRRSSGGVTRALLTGWGKVEGAIATSVSHDAHNLVVLSTDPDSATSAANAVIASKGGIAVSRGNRVLAHMPLPIHGILSDQSFETVVEQQEQLERAASEVGLASSFFSPVFAVTLTSISCAPGPHLTDAGIVEDGTVTPSSLSAWN